MLAIRRRARFTSVQAHDLKLSKLHRLRFGRELFRLFPCSMNSMNSMNAQPFPNPCGGMGSPSPASLRPLVDTQIVVPHRLLLGHSRHPGSASTAPGSPHGASLESSLSPDPAHDRSHSNGPACNSSVGASPADTSRPGHVHYTAPISASAVAGMVRGVLITPPPHFLISRRCSGCVGKVRAFAWRRGALSFPPRAENPYKSCADLPIPGIVISPRPAGPAQCAVGGPPR